MDKGRLLLFKFAKAAPLTYAALKAFIEKERPDWIRKLIPRNIDAQRNIGLRRSWLWQQFKEF